MLSHHHWGAKRSPSPGFVISHRNSYQVGWESGRKWKQASKKKEKGGPPCQVQIFFENPSFYTNDDRCSRKLTCLSLGRVGESCGSSSKILTSPCYSSSPNHLPRNLCCIIAVCKNQNIWYGKLITDQYFTLLSVDGIFMAILQP